MRTSKISRETARVVNALSRSTRPRRFPQRHSTTAVAEESPPGQDHSESELSTPPPSPDSSKLARGTSLGKRKRGTTETLATSIKPIHVESTEVRRSPRKAAAPTTGEEKKRKPKRQPAKRIKSEDGAVVNVQPPANWEQVYNVTAQMRKKVLAPVDTMGCESLAEENVAPETKRLQTLVSLMLSSQTKDTVTAVAMRNLQQGLPGGFCLDSLLEVEPAELNRLIEKVGFHNNKTKYIKSMAAILKEKYSGDIPDTIDGLVGLPGVGPKMAYLCMSAAWERDEGIGVDVHVHRITNLWGWHKTNTPEQTRAELEAWLPKEKWHDINHLLVGFGQTICAPVGRKCDDCDLSKQKLCPSAVAGSPKKKKKKIKQEIVLKADGEDAVKTEAAVEADDTAATVRIKSEDVGDVQIGASVQDIEDFRGGGTRIRIGEPVDD